MGIGYSNIPKEYDIEFIGEHSGVEFDGRMEHDAYVRVYYMDPDGDKLDIVADTIANYDVAYLIKRLPERIAEVQALRDEKIGSFVFGGMAIELDLETKANLTGVVSGLDRNPDVEGLDWSLGGGEFVYLDRATLYGLADAAFLHVQACFSHARTVITTLKEQTNCTELNAIDVTAGWPGDVAAV